jgi:hypothetical protein
MVDSGRNPGQRHEQVEIDPLPPFSLGFDGNNVLRNYS